MSCTCCDSYLERVQIKRKFLWCQRRRHLVAQFLRSGATVGHGLDGTLRAITTAVAEERKSATRNEFYFGFVLVFTPRKVEILFAGKVWKKIHPLMALSNSSILFEKYSTASLKVRISIPDCGFGVRVG